MVASVCHSTSHREKGDQVGVLSNEVQSLARKQHSFFSTCTPSRTTMRSPAAPSARRSSTSRRPRALPLDIYVGDVGLVCVRARGCSTCAARDGAGGGKSAGLASARAPRARAVSCMWIFTYCVHDQGQRQRRRLW